MNHIYRSIWSEALGAWIAVSELAKGNSKKNAPSTVSATSFALSDSDTFFSAFKVAPTVLATSLLAFTPSVWALPTGHQLIAGQATVAIPTSTQMQINQSSQKAVINWQGFSVAQHEQVNIQQPNANAALLNRVVGQDASQIQGKINANGQVYLVNPNGVVFGKTAQVDVGGLVATTHDIKNDDFMNGKNHFSQNNAKGLVENHGTIQAKEGGVVALIGEKVTNTGTINTPKGSTVLAAGKTVDLDFQGDGLVEVKVSEAALNAEITNRGAIQADGGKVVMSAKSANALIDTVINQEGIVKARGLVERNGEIILEGGAVTQTGSLDVSGNTGGKVSINARAIVDAGKINADGTTGRGGSIQLKASDAIVQTASADIHANGTTQGGTVRLESTNSTFSSGKLSAKGQQGGTIDVLSGQRVVLAAAELNATGEKQGGLVRVGGDFHGTNVNVKNAKTTVVNGATKIKADGGKGKVVIWSDEKTEYYGRISANLAGDIEVSSKKTLVYAGSAEAGQNGKLLLDPTDIIIVDNAGPAAYGIFDPHLATGNAFGYHSAVLGSTQNGVFTENGNIAIASPFDDLIASNSGAVYLFNSTTGSLLATLTGAKAEDRVGINGITALTNGNYVVSSPYWSNGTASNAGAATWGNGLTGISGQVSVSNSLVGSNVNDGVDSLLSTLTGVTVTALTNGNYVVTNQYWNRGSVTDAGAVTWGNGTIGVVGIIGSTNSLVGTISADQVGIGGITALTNGNYVVSSPYLDDGFAVDVGAATWGNGKTGITGVINSDNSLIGSMSGDMVSSNGITALTNGNYVVASPYADVFELQDSGAATWGNGTTGVTGTIDSDNSLVGKTFFDQIGSGGVIALTNGNYVVASPTVNGDLAGCNSFVGAVTWGNGAVGQTGYVTSTNSLLGITSNDAVGSGGVTALTNGHYVVSSPDWDNFYSSIQNVGAVTWGDGITGSTIGFVSSSNSLRGSTINDVIGQSVTALKNGNYVIASPYWDYIAGSTFADAGAVTWATGFGISSGVLNISNSLIGSGSNHLVGSGGITALTNGHYVISSPDWDNGTVQNVGAATWGNGVSGIKGIVSAANSLIGSDDNDWVSNNGIVALKNGNYVVSSPYWDNGTAEDAGAATWGNGVTGIKGIVSSINSLTGSSSGDLVSGGSNSISFFSLAAKTSSFITDGITPLVNGNYVVRSAFWDNGTILDAGAITWGNGITGITGNVSTINSIAGSTTDDFALPKPVVPALTALVSNNYPFGTITSLANGNYLVTASYWDSNGLLNTGRVLVGTPADIFYANGLGQTMTFNPTTFASLLALGTNIVLQASNDIVLNTNIFVPGSTGGAFTLQAGRNIILNGSIITANGNFTAIAGDPAAGVSSGIPSIILGSGATINAGTGRVILAALGGNFFNNTGSVTPINASQWLIYSNDPRTNNRNGMLADAKRYGESFTGTIPSYANSGNWFFYNVVPTLTVRPSTQIIYEGTTPIGFMPIIEGFLDGDTVDSAGIFGSAIFGINNFTGAVGRYNVSYLRGLASLYGYKFIDNTSSIDELIVLPKPIIPNIPESEPIPIPIPIHVHIIPEIPRIINSEQWLTQVTPLQRSTVFLPSYQEILFEDVDRLEIENEGIKLPSKLHVVLSMVIPCSNGIGIDAN